MGEFSCQVHELSHQGRQKLVQSECCEEMHLCLKFQPFLERSEICIKILNFFVIKTDSKKRLPNAVVKQYCVSKVMAFSYALNV